MAIGTPIALGTGTGTTTCNITTTASIPAGAMVVVVSAWINTATAPPTVSDPTNGSYTSDGSTYASGGSGPNIAILRFFNSAAVASGAVISVTGPSFATQMTSSACYVTGIATSAALDAVALNTGSANATTVSVSVSNTNANDIFFGAVSVGLASATISVPSGFTALTGLSNSGGVTLGWAYQIVSTIASRTYNPTFTKGPSAVVIACYKADTGGGPPPAFGVTLSMMGVG